jgi:hypothetical protein
VKKTQKYNTDNAQHYEFRPISIKPLIDRIRLVMFFIIITIF